MLCTGVCVQCEMKRRHFEYIVKDQLAEREVPKAVCSKCCSDGYKQRPRMECVVSAALCAESCDSVLQVECINFTLGNQG